MNQQLTPVIALIFSSCLWGLSWIPLKALGKLGFEGVFLVLSGQAILSLLFLKAGFSYPLIKKYYKPLFGIFLCGGAAILCFTYALIYGDVIRVMVLFYLLPVWGVLGGKLFLGEKIDAIRLSAVSFALFGAFLILGHVKIFSQPPSWIDLIAFSSGLFFAANNLFFRGVDQLPLTSKLLTMFLGCTCVCLVTMALTSESFPSNAIPFKSYFWLLFYALTWLLMANVLSQWAVTKMEAGRSSVIIIFELFAAVISAVLIGNETIDLIEGIGGLLIVTAAMLEAFRQSVQNRQNTFSHTN